MRFNTKVLLGLITGLVLAGCGAQHAATPTSTSSASPAGLSPTPVPSVPKATATLKNLTWNLNQGEPLTLDSGKVIDYDDEMVLANMCESLEQLEPSGKIVPGLASSVDQTTPTTYVLHLRTGVTFWNGQTMNATDVAFSLNRQLNPSLGSFFEGLTLGAFKSAVATGPDTVTIHLNHADSLFKSLLSTPFGQVIEKSFVTAHGSSYGNPQVGPMCTGPYQFVSWTPGQDIVLKQFPNWWGGSQQKRLTQQVKFTFISDESTATQAEVTGEVNGGFMIPEASLSQLKDAGGTVVNGPSTLFSALAGTSDKGIAGNVKIREAVAHLIEYSGFELAQFGSTGAVARALAGPDTWGSAVSAYKSAYEALPAPTLNVAKARALIKASGIKNPVISIATTAVNPGSSELFDQLTQSAEQAGLKIIVKTMPLDEFASIFTSKSARSPYAFAYYEGNADIVSPLELYDQVALPDGGTNYSGHANATVTKLLTEANTTADPSRQAALVTRAQTIMGQDDDWIPIVFQHLTTFLGKGIGGVQAEFPSVMYTPWLVKIGATSGS